MLKKVISIIMCVLFAFSSIARATDLKFLQDEYKEAERHHLEIQEAVVKSLDLIERIKASNKKLEAAMLDLKQYREKLIYTNKQNLLKSMMAGGLDFLSLASLAFGGVKVFSSVNQAVICFVVSATSEAGSMIITSYFNYDAPYDRKVGQLNTKVSVIKAELDKIDKILKMTGQEIQADAKTKGDNLGQKGAIYRKFDMLIKAVEAAEEKLKIFMQEANNTIIDLNKDIEDLRKEDKPYVARMSELSGRIVVEERRVLDKKMAEALEELKGGISETADIPAHVLTPDASRREGESGREYQQRMIAQFNAWVNSARAEAVSLVHGDFKKVVQGLKESAESLTEMETELADINAKHSVIFIHHPDFPAYDTGRIELHDREAAKMIESGSLSSISVEYRDQDEFLIAGINRASAQISTMQELCKEIVNEYVHYLVLEEKKQKIEESINKTLVNGTQLYQLAYGNFEDLPVEYKLDKEIKAVYAELDVLVDYSVPNVKTGEMVLIQMPVIANPFRGDAKIKKIFAWQDILNKMEKDKAPCLSAISKRKNALRKAFASIMQSRKEMYAQVLPIFENALHALRAAQSTTVEYEQALENTPSGEDMGEGSTPRYVFSLKKFKESFLALLESGKATKGESENMSKQFEALQNNILLIVQRHQVAQGHLDHYLSEYQVSGYSPHNLKPEYVEPDLRSFLYDESKLEELRSEVLQESTSARTRAELTCKEFDLRGSVFWQIYELYKRVVQKQKSVVEMKTDEYRGYRDKLNDELSAISPEDDMDNKLLSLINKTVKDTSVERSNNQQSANAWAPIEMSDTGQPYAVSDIRINSTMVPDTNDTFTLTPEQLFGGKCMISGRISPLNAIVKIELSLDNGTNWTTLETLGIFQYSFTPQINQLYVPQLRITDEYDTVYRFSLIPTSSLGIKIIEKDAVTLVQEALSGIANAYERQDLSTFAQYISKDFLGNRTFLEEGVRFDFDMFANIRLRLQVGSMKQIGKTGYDVTVKWEKSHQIRQTGDTQNTTGQTTMIFTLEDGIMKLKNLRGDLLYATLSPEIAQSSGIKSSEIDAIRSARDTRTPVQPGAASAQTAQQGTGTPIPRGLPIKQASVTVGGHSINGAKGYDFETGRIVSMGDASTDLIFEGNIHFQGNCTFVAVSESFDSLTVAPAINGGWLDPQPDQTYAFKTASGLYGKLYMFAVSDLGGSFRTDFKYAIQTDGSLNISTN